ncbi:MAG: Crp/Fnr family transcriptional regulator [Bacteroidota bacterium]
MLQPFFDRYNSIYPLSEELKNTLEKELEIIEVPKNYHLLKDGQRDDYVYVLLKGLLRTYYIKDDTEICSRFMEEQHICMSVISFFSRKAGYEYMETLEPSILARIHYDRLQFIYKNFIEFNYTARVMTEQYFTLSEQRTYLLRKHTSEERYVLFMQQFPSFLQRVPLTYIASFLGMNLETLSRIRNKISK